MKVCITIVVSNTKTIVLSWILHFISRRYCMRFEVFYGFLYVLAKDSSITCLLKHMMEYVCTDNTPVMSFRPGQQALSCSYIACKITVVLSVVANINIPLMWSSVPRLVFISANIFLFIITPHQFQNYRPLPFLTNYMN